MKFLSTPAKSLLAKTMQPVWQVVQNSAAPVLRAIQENAVRSISTNACLILVKMELVLIL